MPVSLLYNRVNAEWGFIIYDDDDEAKIIEKLKIASLMEKYAGLKI